MATVEKPVAAPAGVAQAWLDGLAAALESRSRAGLERLFTADGWWRDLLAFTWDLRTFHGRDRILTELSSRIEAVRPARFRLGGGPAPERGQGLEAEAVVAFFQFETALARCYGVARLKPAEGGWQAWTLLTAMEELKGFEERTGHRRPKAAEPSPQADEPDVLIVGAGQCGLALGARLRMLGVDTLVVDRNRRVGDNWRNRYETLALHDPVWFDHLPYLPFPPSWPVFSPKDRIADWLEAYARIMGLDVATGSQVVGGSYAGEEGRWSVRIRDADGAERTLRPHQVVIATGMSGLPHVPDLPGADRFKGTLVHSTGFKSGREFAGRKAVVVGSSNSGHDIAQDLHAHGAEVTMVQRSPTYVINSEDFLGVLLAGRYEEGGPPTELADKLSAATPYPLLAGIAKVATDLVAQMEAPLLDGLRKQGFETWFGEDGAGIALLYARRGGGYYINVGASELIAAGEIKVRRGEARELTEEALVLHDGTTLRADLVVLATGFQNMRESARLLFGDAVADRCTPVWGLDEEGELRTVWRRSGHERLWFMGGSLQQARIFSRLLALQIKAVEEGLIPA